MPLKHSSSKKAFVSNLKAEMNEGKPQPQALAIAYSVKRKAKKKASGGTVISGSKDMNYAEGGPVSAKTEKRSNIDMQDIEELSRNRGDKAPGQDSWTDRPDIRQSTKGMKTTRIKHPTMAQSPVFKVKMRDEEDDLQSSAGTNEGPQRQPPKEDDEMGPDRQGPQVLDMEDEHSTHRKPYAKGGQIEASDEHHELGGKYEDDLLDLSPSHDEGRAMADSHDEMDADEHNPNPLDMEREHSNGRMPYARGGEVSPHDEEEMEREDSIAAAIMAKRDRMHADIDSGAYDMDHAVRMADGGEILDDADMHEIHSHGSMDTHESADQADLSRNADEDANEEDQASFNALRKENYSETPGLKELNSPMDSAQHGDDREDETSDPHDMVDKIRHQMKARRQFKAR